MFLSASLRLSTKTGTLLPNPIHPCVTTLFPPLVSVALLTTYLVAALPSPKLLRATLLLSKSARFWLFCNAPVMRPSFPRATSLLPVPNLTLMVLSAARVPPPVSPAPALISVCALACVSLVTLLSPTSAFVIVTVPLSALPLTRTLPCTAVPAEVPYLTRKSRPTFSSPVPAKGISTPLAKSLILISLQFAPSLGVELLLLTLDCHTLSLW